MTQIEPTASANRLNGFFSDCMYKLRDVEVTDPALLQARFETQSGNEVAQMHSELSCIEGHSITGLSEELRERQI